MKNIIVTGGDGYIGWPLSFKLALTFPEKSIIIVDNFSRRSQVVEVGSDSLIPILSLDDRIKQAKILFNINNISYVNIDVSSEKIDDLIALKKPGVIFHLAQQASAPYSMMSSDNAIFTLRNNEVGNMRLLWAIRNHCPEAHLIKMGSFGEYAMGGIDVSEGDFNPSYNGVEATSAVPYPRRSDDFYHASKINDSNYISIATRKWGLKVTEIMQSTIFGSYINETFDFKELHTRFDYDECFGTVLNRFIVQAVLGEPLTIYGTGNQRTGLMAMVDSVNSLVDLSKYNSILGEHRIINHVTESNFSINEIASLVIELCKIKDIPVSLSQIRHDPRDENVETKMDYKIENHYTKQNVMPTPIREVISKTLEIVIPLKHKINRNKILPSTTWS